MKKLIVALAGAIAVLASVGVLAAHHSLGNFDLSTPIHVKGTVVLFARVNPHSLIFLDQKTDDGHVRRWAVDGPGLLQLGRMGLAQDFLKAGDVIEVCGFPTKEGAKSVRGFTSSANSDATATSPNISGQVMSGHVLVMPDRTKRFWSDYGQLEKCLGPGETRDSLIR